MADTPPTDMRFDRFVQALVFGGTPIAEVALDIGIPLSTAYRWADKHGLPTNPKVTPRLARQIGTALKMGGPREVAALFRVTEATVQKIVATIPTPTEATNDVPTA